MISLAQPSLVLNTYGVRTHYHYSSFWRSWSLPQNATSKDIVNWIAIACDQAPELALHHVVLHAHAEDAVIYVGEDANGNPNNAINILNVADFQPLASRDIGCIWLHACRRGSDELRYRILFIASRKKRHEIGSGDRRTTRSIHFSYPVPAGRQH